MNYDALLESFFQSEVQNTLEFPEELENIYSAIVSILREEYPQVDTGSYNLDDESSQSGMCQ